MVKKEQHLIYVTPNGRVEHIEDYVSKGRIEHIVDFLFTIPVTNSNLSNKELIPSIYVDEKGNKHQFKKISHNSPQAIDCVEYGYKAWKERNPNNNIDQWRNNIIDMLNTYTEQTRDKTLKLKMGAYINLVDLFVHQEKKEKVKVDKYSSVNERLYALTKLCPEFIDSLKYLSQKEQKEIMQIITNSHGDNILKKLIYKNSPMDVDDKFEDKIDRIKNKISKKKV